LTVNAGQDAVFVGPPIGEPRKVLEKFAVSHLALPVGKIGQIFDEVADGVNETQVMLSAYMDDHPEFKDVGSRMLTEWNEGVKATLSG